MANSVHKQVRDLEVGDRIFIERDSDVSIKNLQKKLANPAKHPQEIIEYRFSSSLYLGVSRSDGSTNHLLCVTRIK